MLVACIICSFYPILLTVLVWIVVFALCYPEYRREYPKPRKLCYTTNMTLTASQWRDLDRETKRLVLRFVTNDINACQFNYNLVTNRLDEDVAHAAVRYLHWQAKKCMWGVGLVVAAVILLLVWMVL